MVCCYCMRSQIFVRAGLCLAVIACGLALRTGFGWPFGVVKYGGSVLWGAMVFFLVATIAPGRSRPGIGADRGLDRGGGRTVPAGASSLAGRFPTDHRRRAAARAQVFSPWNVVAYIGGIGAAALLDRLAVRASIPIEPERKL